MVVRLVARPLPAMAMVMVAVAAAFLIVARTFPVLLDVGVDGSQHRQDGGRHLVVAPLEERPVVHDQVELVDPGLR